jgi:hypothetical protein
VKTGNTKPRMPLKAADGKVVNTIRAAKKVVD